MTSPHRTAPVRKPRHLEAPTDRAATATRASASRAGTLTTLARRPATPENRDARTTAEARREPRPLHRASLARQRADAARDAQGGPHRDRARREARRLAPVPSRRARSDSHPGSATATTPSKPSSPRRPPMPSWPGTGARDTGALPEAGAGRGEFDYRTTRTPATAADRMAVVAEIDDYVTRTYPGLLNADIALSNLAVEKALVTSEGAATYSYVPRSNVVLRLATQGNDGVVDLYQVYGGFGDFEDRFGRRGLDVRGRRPAPRGGCARRRDGTYCEPAPTTSSSTPTSPASSPTRPSATPARRIWCSAARWRATTSAGRSHRRSSPSSTTPGAGRTATRASPSTSTTRARRAVTSPSSRTAC